MPAERYHRIRERLESDADYHQGRIDFLNDYEWLEGYWDSVFGSRSAFIRRYADYYWELESVRQSARLLAQMECVGNSDDDAYQQTGQIARATMHLRYHADLFSDGEVPSCDDIGCRDRKVGVGRCRPERGREWPEGPYGAFKAVMDIVRQVRNNLVHGNKHELTGDQLDRNRTIIRIARNLTATLWEALPAAEETLET